MSRYPSVEAALDALQSRTQELERRVAADTALELLRERAFGQQLADETAGLAAAALDTARALGVPAIQIGLVGDVDDAGHAAVWLAGVDPDGQVRASQVESVLAGHPVLDATAEAAAHGDEVHQELDADALHAYLHAALAQYPASYAERVVARVPPADAYHYVFVPTARRVQGALYAVLSAPPTDEARDLLRRLSALYDHAYVRAHDLQQADVYARAAQIEASLERVRSRALAMRATGEFDAVVGALFREMDELGVPADRRLVAVVDADGDEAAVWASARGSDEPVVGTLPLGGYALGERLRAAWLDGHDLSYILEGRERERWLARLATATPGLPAPPAAAAREYVHSVASPSGVFVALADRPFAEDTVQVLHRLARTLHVARTRYQDLLHAEDQAVEAARQASVDRLRAEIASMRTTADLDRVTPLVWHELTTLGIPFVRCGVFIVEDEGDAVRALLGTPTGEPLGALVLPVETDPLLGQVVAHWRSQTVLTETWGAERMATWARTLAERGMAAATSARTDALALTLAPFAQGMLYVGSPRPLDAADAQTVQDLADAFAVAYARYDDFQRLDAQKRELEATLADLRAAQAQLIQSEKLASLGALTAGIAHEIKNPLNFVNNFAVLSRELADEIAAEIASGGDPELVAELVADLQSNAQRIEHHGRRADSIVRGMMQHARTGEGRRETVRFNALVEEHVALAYHGRRAQTPGFSVTLDTTYADDVGLVEVVPQDLGRVLINLVSNAFDAVATHASEAEGGYQPTVCVTTRRAADGGVEVLVDDNGTGIPEDVQARIFEPFFTTKPAGQGTGLGLSMSHEIVESHGGRLRVEQSARGGAAFIVWLPEASGGRAATDGPGGDGA